jgi:2-oxoglutarate ferredoxin oxidoreductase subunit beta
MSEILAETVGTVYIARHKATDIASIRKLKKSIKRAFLAQVEGLGFACVEVLSTCPTNWNMDAWDAMKWVEENMTDYYPLGTYKMTDAVKALKV